MISPLKGDALCERFSLSTITLRHRARIRLAAIRLVPDSGLGRRKDGTLPSKYQIYQRIAPFYDLVDLPSEYLRYQRIRPQLFVGLAGRILDAGVGTGRNIPFYPRQSQVVGIDLSPAMLTRARMRRTRFGSDVELREMDVCKTDFPDGYFDAVVSTFLFCVLDDSLQLPALRELARICRPGCAFR